MGHIHRDYTNIDNNDFLTIKEYRKNSNGSWDCTHNYNLQIDRGDKALEMLLMIAKDIIADELSENMEVKASLNVSDEDMTEELASGYDSVDIESNGQVYNIAIVHAVKDSMR